MSLNPRANGFTLLEILIALAIFALLATLTSTALYRTINVRDHLIKQTNQLSHLEHAFSLFDQDIRHIIPRPLYMAPPSPGLTFVGEQHVFTLTRGGILNPDALEKRSTLQHVTYLCLKGNLIRRRFTQLDFPQADDIQDRVLLHDLVICRFAYYAPDHTVHTAWPMDAKTPLPAAIQLSLQLKTKGKISLLFKLPEETYATTTR